MYAIRSYYASLDHPGARPGLLELGPEPRHIVPAALAILLAAREDLRAHGVELAALCGVEPDLIDRKPRGRGFGRLRGDRLLRSLAAGPALRIEVPADEEDVERQLV